jgi:hypothetical protein
MRLFRDSEQHSNTDRAAAAATYNPAIPGTPQGSLEVKAMRTADSQASPSPNVAAWIVAITLSMIIIPAAITLHAVRSPGKLVVAAENPTPYGYTVSLLLFIVPILVIAFVIAFWFLPSEGLDVPQRAFWRTIGILVPAGFVLDF